MKSRMTRLGAWTLVGASLSSVSSARLAAPRFSAPPQEREACGVYCGTERWPIKTLSDADHNKVDFTPKEATVGWLISQERLSPSPPDQRIGPIETQTYKVRARLITYKLEEDGDFHIVIADVEDPSKTMIAEIPSPDCAGACASGHAEEFRKARAVIMGLSDQVPSVVVVTGVGFFDFLHGQTGAAPNGIELHPVLKIELESDPSLPSVSSPKTNAENKNGEVRVWVNTNSGVYHCPGTRWYGATRNGTFMTEAEAQQRAYRPAYGTVCGPVGTATTSRQQETAAPDSETQGAGNPDVKVWVNTSSRVYHCQGTRWYGNTKQGKYMGECEAKRAGYRPAYDHLCGSSCL